MEGNFILQLCFKIIIITSVSKQVWMIFFLFGGRGKKGEAHLNFLIKLIKYMLWIGILSLNKLPVYLNSTDVKQVLNRLTPNVNCSGRTAPLTSKVAFYIFIQQI